MKYIVLLGDGMADEPIAELDGKTPLQVAHTPHMDSLARDGEIGLANTVPTGYHPGSDVANLSVFGYDPAACYTGRSPLEASSMGIELGPEDVAFRLNLVHLHPHFGHLYMEDFSAGHIPTDEARPLVELLQQELGDERFQFHPGVSYRHLMVWRGGAAAMKTVPPHDISGQCIGDYLPRGEGGAELVDLMTSAQMLLKRHPVNIRREQEEKPTANSIWLWGQGKLPKMETYREKFGLTGAVISAVDLIKGIGINAGLQVIEVEGATGYIDTDYRGKAEAALQALEKVDFVYLHVEAPDEASHSGNLPDKLQAIEDFDREVVGPVLEGLKALGPHRVLVLPDHPTPLALKTHTSAAVPYLLFDSAGSIAAAGADGYTEQAAAASGLRVDPGFGLLPRMLGLD